MEPDHDPYFARQRFGLSGRASDEALARRVLEHGGSSLDYGTLSTDERWAFYSFAVALGSEAADDDSPEVARIAARRAAEWTVSEFPPDLVRSMAKALYPPGVRSVQAVLTVVGINALRVDVESDGDGERFPPDPGEDEYDDLARRHGL